MCNVGEWECCRDENEEDTCGGQTCPIQNGFTAFISNPVQMCFMWPYPCMMYTIVLSLYYRDLATG